MIPSIDGKTSVCYLGNEAVGGAVAASRAVVHHGVGEHFGAGVHLFVTLFQQLLSASFHIFIHCCIPFLFDNLVFKSLQDLAGSGDDTAEAAEVLGLDTALAHIT